MQYCNAYYMYATHYCMQYNNEKFRCFIEIFKYAFCMLFAALILLIYVCRPMKKRKMIR